MDDSIDTARREQQERLAGLVRERVKGMRRESRLLELDAEDLGNTKLGKRAAHVSRELAKALQELEARA